ncbi:MAG: hypothetical protein WB699_09165 [Bacteroidota bacterium]
MPPLSERVTIAAGMAVSYISAGDIVNLVNATPGALEQTGTYKTGIQFFGSVELPISPLWMIKADYAYLIASYNIASGFGNAGTAEYTVTAHLPSIVFQYNVVDKPEYAFRLGLGAGYHVGQLSTTFFSQTQTYSATGIGAVLEAEGMTAVSENIFAVLGASARWEWIGALKNSLGLEPTNISNAITLNMFAPSIKIGVVYAF